MTVVWVLVAAGVLLYGVNIFLYFYLKKRPHWQIGERLGLYLSVNMSMLFVDGIFLFIAKLFEEAVFVLE